jgi:ATP-dependent exoDNAse (exonuclease V) alpha subunit
MSNIGAKHLDGSSGRSVIAAIAYRTASMLVEYKSDEAGNTVEVVHDFTAKRGVYCTNIIAPIGAPSWVYDPVELWNKVTKAEKRKDARYAQDITIALPNELSLEQNKKLVEDFIRDALVSQGMVVQYAIHIDDSNNIHAHITATTRVLTRDGFGLKIESIGKRGFVAEVRKEWSEVCNEYLARNGFDVRISHLSNKDLGIELGATIHEGFAARKLAGMGVEVEVVEYNKNVRKNNIEMLKATPELLINQLVASYNRFQNKDISHEIAKLLKHGDSDDFEGEFSVIFNGLMSCDTLKSMRVGGEGEHEFHYDSCLFKGAKSDDEDDVAGDEDAVNIKSKIRVVMSKTSVLDEIKHEAFKDISKIIAKPNVAMAKPISKNYENDKIDLESVFNQLYDRLPELLPEFGFRRSGSNLVSTTNVKSDGSSGDSKGKVYIYADNPGVIIDYSRGNVSVYKYMRDNYYHGSDRDTFDNLRNLTGNNNVVMMSKVNSSAINLEQKNNKDTSSASILDQKKIMNIASGYFTSNMASADKATISYVSGRFKIGEIDNSEYLSANGYLGYHDGDYWKLHKYLIANGVTKEAIKEHLKLHKAIGKSHKLILPWRDEVGDVVGFIARDISGDSDKGLPKYLYSKGLKRSMLLYNIDKIVAGEPLYIVEGQIDAMTMIALGKSNVVALGGASLNQKQIELIKSKNITEIRLCLDNDDAGRVATTKIVSSLQDNSSAIILKQMTKESYRGAKDINELALQSGDASVLDRLEFNNIAAKVVIAANAEIPVQELPTQESLAQELPVQESVTQEDMEINPELLKMRVISHLELNKYLFSKRDVRDVLDLELGVMCKDLRNEIYTNLVDDHFHDIGEDDYGINWLVRRSIDIDLKAVRSELRFKCMDGFSDREIDNKCLLLSEFKPVEQIPVEHMGQVADICKQVISKLSNNSTCFTREEIERAIAVEIEQLKLDILRHSSSVIVEQILASSNIVKTARTDLRGRDLYSTKLNLEYEAEIIASANLLAKSNNNKISAKYLDETLADSILNDSQKGAVRYIIESNDLVVIEGLAGVGKTTMLGVLNDYNHHHGKGEIYGLSAYGIAAQGMEDKAGIASRTITSFEFNNDYIKEGGIIVVDEAGVISNKTMANLIKISKEKKCKLVLIGDSLQTQAIEAGASFNMLSSSLGAYRLNEIVRQKGRQKDASESFAMGDYTSGFSQYKKAGKSFSYRDGSELQVKIIDRYISNESDSKAIIVNNNKAVSEINRLVHDRLVLNGSIKNDQFIKLGIDENIISKKFGIGEQVIFLKNDSKLQVKNGMIGKIKDIKDNHVTVYIADSNREVSFDGLEYGSIDYGYGLTIEKSQGATFKNIYCGLDNSNIGARRSFVAFTRHSENLEIHYDKSVFKNDKALINVIGRDDGKFNASRYQETHIDVMASDIYYRNVYLYKQVIDVMGDVYKNITKSSKSQLATFDEQDLYKTYKELYAIRSDLAYIICDDYQNHREYLQEAGKVYRDNIKGHASKEKLLFEDDIEYEQNIIQEYKKATDINKRLELADEITRARAGYVRFYEDEIYNNKIDINQLRKDAADYAKLIDIDNYGHKLIKYEQIGYGTHDLSLSDERDEFKTYFNHIKIDKQRYEILQVNIKRQEEMIADQEFVKLTSELYIADYEQNKQDNQHNEQATIRLEMHKRKLDLANQELDRLHNDPIYEFHQEQLKQVENQLSRFKNEQDFKQLNKIKDKVIETEIDYTLANLLLKENLINLQQQAQDNKQALAKELDSNHKIKSYINNLNQSKSEFKAATKLTRAIITKEMELTQTEIRLNKLNPENQAHQNKIVKLNKQKDTLTKLLATHKDDLQAELKTTNIHKFADTTLAYMTLKEAINPNILAKYGIGITNKHQPLFEKKVLTGIEYEQDRQNKAKNLEERQKTIKTNGADYEDIEQKIENAQQELEAVRLIKEEQPKIYKTKQEEIEGITEEIKELIKDEGQANLQETHLYLNQSSMESLERSIKSLENSILKDKEEITSRLKESLEEKQIGLCERIIAKENYEDLHIVLSRYLDQQEVKGLKVFGMMSEKTKRRLGMLAGATKYAEDIVSKKEKIKGYSQSILEYQAKISATKLRVEKEVILSKSRKVKIDQLMSRLKTIQPIKKMDERIKEHFGLNNNSGGFRMG